MNHQMLFQTPYGLQVTSRQVVEDIVRFMEAAPNHRYKIIIGTDSEGYQAEEIDFVTAVVVHRVGNGGKYFWRRQQFPRFYTLRDRIINEVILSIEVARHLLEVLKDSKAPEFSFEIHADVGENGDTKAIISEVVGMIRAYNFEARTKPESYAASSVADRYV